MCAMIRRLICRVRGYIWVRYRMEFRERPGGRGYYTENPFPSCQRCGKDWYV
jgi:hypothetical protein